MDGAPPVCAPGLTVVCPLPLVVIQVLALLMNILYTAAPDAAPPEHGQMGESLQDVAVLRKLLVAMEREHGLDLLVYAALQLCSTQLAPSLALCCTKP